MATKKQEKLSFGQMPMPSQQTSYTYAKYSWSGLNRRQTIDTGALSSEMNISTAEAPYLTPSENRKELLNNQYKNPVAMFAFEDFLIVLYRDDKVLNVDYIKLNKNGASNIYTGLVKNNATSADDKEIRSMVQFNSYNAVNDVLDGEYVKKLILFPDKRSMYFKIIDIAEKPTIKTATDLNAMYYVTSGTAAKTYWVWDNGKQDFVQSGGTGYFKMDALDVDVKTYYNDGYVKTSDTTYDENNPKDYFSRTLDNSTKKYIYSNVTGLTNGADVSSYYEFIKSKGGYVLTDDTEYDSSKTYYKKSGNNFDEVKNLADNDKVSNFYEYLDDYYPPDNDCDKNCYWKNSYDENTYKYVKVDNGSASYAWRISIAPAFPNLKYATVHLSRLFGVDDERVYVSGFNDYTNWNLDVMESEESNAWVSAAQSNTKADGQFTGIAVYDNHVVCFKHDYMHEIYNNKNPFRLQDIYAEGCIDNRSIQEVDGKLIFVSQDEVKVYTGGNPRIIGYYLGIDNFRMAVSGTDGRNYYLYCLDDKGKAHLFTYDTFAEQWSEQETIKTSEGYDVDVLYFGHNKCGMFMLCDNGMIYKMDTGTHDLDWSFETDLSTALSSSSSSGFKSVNIKHIRKIQMYVYIKPGSTMKIYGLYDEDIFNADSAHLLFDSEKDGLTGMIPIRIKPRMTASYGFKLHFEGHGYVRIHSMEVYKTQGGELYE